MPLQAQLAHHNRVGRAGGAGGVVAAAVQHLVGQNRKGNGLLGVAVQDILDALLRELLARLKDNRQRDK